MTAQCDVCGGELETISAVVGGVYHQAICRPCLGSSSVDSSFSSGYQRHDRNRQYEDNAQDTVQPYNAAGKPNKEFYRLYPDAAARTFTQSEIEQVRSQI